MAVDEYLLDRLRRVLRDKNAEWNEKRMFGGNCFMVDDKMCFGTFRDGVMVRIDPDDEDELLKKEGVRQMILKDKPMKGFLFLVEAAYDYDADLDFWVQKCLEFNPRAKASKKKKR